MGGSHFTSKGVMGPAVLGRLSEVTGVLSAIAPWLLVHMATTLRVLGRWGR